MLNRELPDDFDPGCFISRTGLSPDDVLPRRARYGYNDIIAPAKSPWYQLAADTAADPMIWFLALMATLYAAIGEYRDAALLAAALAPLVGLDAYLHHRTMASTRGLALHLAATSRVIRDTRETSIPARDLVPGDLVMLTPGDRVPADVVILDGTELQADESSVTGESLPARKTRLDSAARRIVPIDSNWLFAGTRLLAGSALVRIVYTGGATLYGQIAHAAASGGGGGATPLQLAIRRLVGLLLMVAVAFCITLAAVRLWQGHGFLDAIMSALTLAIAALPEEFPIVFTFYLGLGVFRLAQCKALVRRAVAIENIGRITCICSDKTGTMTEGRLELAHCEPGTGTSPDQLVALAAEIADPASTDPLDLALAGWVARIAGPAPAPLGPRIAAFAFTEARRRETAVFRETDDTLLAAVKGAPETILAMCADDAASKATWLGLVERYAQGGHKVILCATRRLTAAGWKSQEPETGFTCVGLLAFEDRLRAGVEEALATCRRAGIRVIMVTGDHPVTARAIAAEIGLGGGSPVVATADILAGAKPGDSRLAKVDVIARAAPGDKLQLVRMLQEQGEIVAVTGDGINDVPALQAADIGIAMGERGTQSAREIAAIVLIDDNFRTITRAIAEGRQLLANLTRSFAYLIAIHVPLVTTAALLPLLGYPILYLPIHIVWLELIIHPTALLVFQQPAPHEILPRQNRDAARFFDRRTWLALITAGLVVAAIIFGLFTTAFAQSGDVGAARALSLVTLLGAGASATLALRPRPSTIGWLVILGSLASALLFVQVAGLAAWMHVSPLPAPLWLLAILLGAAGGGLVRLGSLRQAQVKSVELQPPLPRV
jgi:Ca2+-transporting ATPase